jgi:aconitate hydratase
MGVLPVELADGQDLPAVGIDGTEIFAVHGLAGAEPDSLIGASLTLSAQRAGGETVNVPVIVRLDTPMEAAYFHHGGILPYVLRQHLREQA